MAELVVIGYPDESTAQKVYDKLGELQKGFIVDLSGASVVSRSMDGKLHVDTPTHATGLGASSGAFWGLLIGLLFFIPVGGLIIGGIMGAIFGKMGDLGIKDEYRQQVNDLVKPGTSAVVMMVNKATPDKAIAALAPFGGTVLRTSVSQEVEDELQAALDAKGATA